MRIMRIDKENYYLNIAETVLERSSCIRRNFGAIIVKNDRIITTGYNGSSSGEKNCCDSGECVRNKLKFHPGEGYEYCNAIHAEQNALLNISRDEAIGASLFLVGIDVESKEYFTIGPCYICINFIKCMGIKKVYIRKTKQTYKIIEI